MTATAHTPCATISVPEAAARLGISPRTAYRLARSGELPAIELGRSIRIPRERLEALIRGEA